MPRAGAWIVRISLLYLVAGFTLGALLLSNEGFAYLPAIWRFLPVHVEVLVLGWMVQFALGVAYWILPRFRAGWRGSLKPVWLGAALFNAGLLLSIAALLLNTTAVLAGGRALEALGAGLLILNLWEAGQAIRGELNLFRMGEIGIF